MTKCPGRIRPVLTLALAGIGTAALMAAAGTAIGQSSSGWPCRWTECANGVAVGVTPEIAERIRASVETGEPVALEALVDGLRYHFKGEYPSMELLVAVYRDGELAGYERAGFPEEIYDPVRFPKAVFDNELLPERVSEPQERETAPEGHGEHIVRLRELPEPVASSHRRVIAEAVEYAGEVSDEASPLRSTGAVFDPGLHSVGIDPGMVWIARDDIAGARPPARLQELAPDANRESSSAPVGIIALVPEADEESSEGTDMVQVISPPSIATVFYITYTGLE